MYQKFLQFLCFIYKSLLNHLNRTDNTCSFGEAVEGIIKLRRLHKEMDEMVLKSYGWTDINLNHDFYEVDYLVRIVFAFFIIAVHTEGYTVAAAEIFH